MVNPSHCEMRMSDSHSSGKREPVGRTALISSVVDEALEELGGSLRRLGYRFITATPATHARVNARPGNELGRSLTDIFGWSRPFEPGALATDLFALMQQAAILEKSGAWYRSLLRVSSLGDELLFHSAYPTDQADAVFFGPDTYRFANFIERQLADRSVPINRAVDIGCGTGAGAILIAKALPHADVAAVDINPRALDLCRVNASLAGTANLTPAHSDLLGQVSGEFDLVVANPPFMLDAPGRAYRDGGGPLGGGLSIAIVEAALDRLSPGGILLLYTGSAVIDGHDGLREGFTNLLGSAQVDSWTYAEMDPDIFGEELDTSAYAGADRIAAVTLTMTRSR